MEKYLPFAGAIALPFAGGLIAGYIATKGADGWYESLKKPSFCPPKWLFTPVWTTMYTSMGTASYLVWKAGGGFKGDALMPLTLYGSHLALNWLWTPIFFGAHKKGLAFAEVLLMWGNVGACTIAFYSINKSASYLMMPYWAWLTFESVLSYRIWQDNKDKDD